MEKQASRKQIYDGKVIHVYKDEVTLDNGDSALREIVLHNGGVCIALQDGEYFYMVKQYRYAQGKEMLEFPAGKIEKDEIPDKAIIREVQEETGFTAKNIKKFGSIIPTCGYSSERIHLYYGQVDNFVGQHFDVDESIDLYKYKASEIKQMIKDGTIDDSKTIALMYKLELEGIC